MKTRLHPEQALAPQAFCRQVLSERYLAPGEDGIDDVLRRVARALASVELTRHREWHTRRFLEAMRAGFIPAGRIQASAGVESGATLVNCFVQPLQPYGRPAFWREGVREALATMAAGGGVGYDLSDLPSQQLRELTQAKGGPPSPLEFLDIMEERVSEAGPIHARRAAQMAVLRIDHPDVIAFIQRKRRGGLAHFNLSVAITDAFMHAVKRDEHWRLMDTGTNTRDDDSLEADVSRQVSARYLMQQLQDASFACGEPGIIFIDRVSRDDALSDQTPSRAANPCGEQFLPDYGGCNLGSIDLTRFVSAPFTHAAHFQLTRFVSIVSIAVRALDNVIEIAQWPLPQQAELALRQRRIGLGFTGLGDALFMLGLRYDSAAGRAAAARIARCLRDSACAASIRLARERGSFPDLDTATYLAKPRAASRLPPRLQQRIRQLGIRNSHRLSIAPTGSISLAFADNVSPGIEPIFGCRVRHREHTDDRGMSALVADHAWRLFRARSGSLAPLPSAFVTAAGVSPVAQLRMLASITPFVDAGISKTIWVPADYPRSAFDRLARQAWLVGVKAFACYRSNPDIAPAMSADCESGADPFR